MSSRHPFAPVANIEFLEGLLCSPDTVKIEKVINYREKYVSEREEFFDAFLEVSEAISVNGQHVSVDIEIARVHRVIDDLNRSMPASWWNGVKRSFKFGIRIDEVTLGAALAAALEHANDLPAAYQIGTVLVGTVKVSVDMFPDISHDAYTKAMTYALGAKSTLG